MLTNIYDALEDNGFLLFFEMTTVLPTLLWGLDAQCWNFEDEREFGLWVPRERWEKLLREVGFTEVRSCPPSHRLSRASAMWNGASSTCHRARPCWLLTFHAAAFLPSGN